MTLRRKARFRSAAEPQTWTPAAVAAAFDPARLTQGRNVAGVSRKDLADDIGVTPATISQYEANITHPRPDIIPTIAEVLGTPMAFFAAGRPMGSLTVADVHLDNARVPMRSRLKAAATIGQIWELMFALERHVQVPFVDLPGVAGGESGPSPIGPVEAARLVRGRWGISGPFGHLTRHIECHGIVVAEPSADQDIDAIGPLAAIKLPRPVIVTSAAMTSDVYEWRWQIARMLGHLLLHAGQDAGLAGQWRSADLFAAELLLPAGEVVDQLARKMTARRLIDAQHTWGAPIEVIINRRYQLGLACASTASSAKGRMSDIVQPRRAADYPGETPMLLAGAFRAADGVTVSTLAADLAWHNRRVVELLPLAARRPELRIVEL